MKEEVEINFEQCMKCTICNDYCPMMAVNASYKGPKLCGPDGERHRIHHPSIYDDTLKYCLNCKRCETACPSDVRIADLIQKAKLDRCKGPSLRDRMLASTDFVGKAAGMVAPLANWALHLGVTRKVLDGAFGVDSHRVFPTYSSKTFESWFGREAKPLQGQFATQVSYFHGCYVNYNFPKLGQDLVKILNAAGVGVNLLEGERCCGVAFISNGMKKQALDHARSNVSAIEHSADEGREVLTTSSTCTFTMRDEYEHILDLDSSHVRSNLTMAVKWLYEQIEAGKIHLAFREGIGRKVAYHAPCHMEKLGWSIYSTALIKMIPGLELTVLPSGCCGIAGTFGFKKEYYDYSQKIGSDLFDEIRNVNPDIVATDCETCKWQIEMSTGYNVQNPVSILADALDIEKTIELNK